MNENKHTHENADLLKRLRHIAGLDAENYGALPEDAAEWKAADLIETITKQRDELLAALEHFATWARCQHRAQSKGCHATFDMMMLRDEIDFAEAAIANAKGTTP